MFISYVSKQSGASYDQFDWQVYVNDTAIDCCDLPIDGPTPELGSGDLPKGRKAAGWLDMAVPAHGRITLAYQPSANDEPVFEVVLRSK